MDADLSRDLDAWVEQLGFELVDAERAGDQQRPILRLRIDRPDSAPGTGVSLDDCATVSRALEAHLDQRPGLSERYVLEVSSPGVERPLVRTRDWTRFAGQEVAIRGNKVLADRARRLEGVLLGPAEPAGEEADSVALELPDGERVEIALADIERANLIFRWGGKPRPA